MVTSRGNAFAFQWPLQPQVFGQSQAAFSTGIMKVAYTGTYDSAKEPGLGGSGGSGYCHSEPAKAYPAGIGYAEELTGLTGYGDSGVLWFVNPWITSTILESSGTTLYIYVIFINTGTTSYSPTAGSIDLTWYGSNHLTGSLIGVYYGGKFYTTSPSIASGASYYAIFKITTVMVDNPPGSASNTPPQSVMWWGAASITDAPGSTAEDQTFFSGSILLSGLWIRYEASAGSCV